MLSLMIFSAQAVCLIAYAADDTSATESQAESQIEILSNKIRSSPSDARLFLARAELFFHLQAFHKAVADLDRTIELDRSLDQAWFWRGMALGRLGKIEKGIDDLSVYIHRNPDDSVGYTKRGVRYLWLGELNKAEKDLATAIALNPENAEAHDDLGVIYARRGETELAIRHFNITVTTDPSYQKGFHNHGVTLQEPQFTRAGCRRPEYRHRTQGEVVLARSSLRLVPRRNSRLHRRYASLEDPL